MSAPSPSEISTSLTGRHQRRARNYLLDPHFQLKYTGVLVAIAIVISAVLGVQLYRTSTVLIEQSRRTVEQGQETVQRGKALLDESRKVSAVVSMNIVKDPVYAENPELLAVFKENAAAQEQNLNAEQARLEGAAKSLQEQSAGLAAQQRNALFIVFGGLSLLVIVIGFAGIVFTHKVAGPIYKMKGLLRRVGDGHFTAQRGLRKGDELQHFFDAFVKMVESLRKRQEATIARIESAIAQLDGSVEPDKLAGLRELRRDMQASLDDDSA
ncbi:MAG: HAMP domain-containing protein [Deltaproteobacteria bacterium]|nr:HAMP domain-containing protein [Deltaproteobacteria bacterium]